MDVCEGLLEDGFEVDSNHAKGEGLRIQFYEIFEFQVDELKEKGAVRGKFNSTAIFA